MAMMHAQNTAKKTIDFYTGYDYSGNLSVTVQATIIVLICGHCSMIFIVNGFIK